MGLDHWLNKVIYTDTYSASNVDVTVSINGNIIQYYKTEEGKTDIDRTPVFEKIDATFNKSSTSLKRTQYPTVDQIHLRVGSWRKENWLHGYIIKHFANGIDECQMIEIDPHQIDQFIDVIQQVLNARKELNIHAAETVAMDLLPPMHGCFFGNYEIDDEYYDGLQRVLDELKYAQTILPKMYCTYIYQASW